MKNYFANINWKVRFSRHNLLFLFRFAGAILVPVIGHLGLNFEDVTSWAVAWDIVVSFFSNPYLFLLTVFNVIIMIPDPTTPGFADSNRALSYKKPGGGR